MNLKKLIKNVLFKNGYHLMRKFYYDFDGNESIRKILKLAKRSPSDLTIIDVGANIGQSVDRFREISDTAKIISFEPNPEAFALLKLKKSHDKNLECYNFGIGSIDGILKFNLQPDSGSSSFKKLNVNSNAFKSSNTKEAKKNHNTTTLKKKIDFNTEINIEVKSLNSVFKNNIPEQIDILKIDTQGYEEEVLRGASNILQNTLIIETEIIFANHYVNQATFKGIEEILSSYGFYLWDIPYIGKFPDEAVNRVNFIDALFVNKSLLESNK